MRNHESIVTLVSAVEARAFSIGDVLRSGNGLLRVLSVDAASGELRVVALVWWEKAWFHGKTWIRNLFRL